MMTINTKISKMTAVLLSFSMLIASGITISQAQTSSSATITCIPVQQIAQDKTQLECRMRSDEIPYFVAAEVEFPFNVTELVKVSSSYSASVALPYPTSIIDDTIYIAPVSWGDSVVDPQIQAIPFDSLSIFVETDQPMKTVKLALEAGEVRVALLSPNPSDPLNPFFQTMEVEEALLFDGSLFLEGFTQYVSPGVLQFLRAGLHCYEQTPQACVSNIIQNL